MVCDSYNIYKLTPAGFERFIIDETYDSKWIDFDDGHQPYHSAYYWAFKRRSISRI